MREDIEYDVLYEECAESEVYFHSMWEHIRGYLDGKSPEEILETEKRISKCTCGGTAELHEFEGMGDGDYTIQCKSCGRTMRRSLYDVDIHDWEEVLEYCIRDWNAGLVAEDIEKRNRVEHERIRLREEDLTWHEYRPNNMECNPVEGCYSLVFKYDEERIYCCKWTIKYQPEEVEPGCVASDSAIEAYNLFEKRIWEVKGRLGYPRPCEDVEFPEKSEHTFSHLGVNDAGDFVRSYRTLEAAKVGAVSRCGWQGLNRDTILREAEVQGKTAEEVIACLSKK